jgi:hypothetical protein
MAASNLPHPIQPATPPLTIYLFFPPKSSSFSPGQSTAPFDDLPPFQGWTPLMGKMQNTFHVVVFRVSRQDVALERDAAHP